MEGMESGLPDLFDDLELLDVSLSANKNNSKWLIGFFNEKISLFVLILSLSSKN